MRRWTEAEVGRAKPVRGVVLGMHSSFAEIGNFVVQIAVLHGTAAKNLIITEGIVIEDRHGFALFDLLREDGIRLQSQCVGREVGEAVGKENVQVLVPLLGIGSG